MWHSGWAWIKTLRGPAPRPRPDLADMGTEIGLDASLESRFPPLMENAAAGPRSTAEAMLPLGTDHRSRFA